MCYYILEVSKLIEKYSPIKLEFIGILELMFHQIRYDMKTMTKPVTEYVLEGSVSVTSIPLV